MNINAAIHNDEVIISGRRLNLFNSHAFNNDIANLVTPTNIDDVNASTLLPTS